MVDDAGRPASAPPIGLPPSFCPGVVRTRSLLALGTYARGMQCFFLVVVVVQHTVILASLLCRDRDRDCRALWPFPFSSSGCCERHACISAKLTCQHTATVVTHHTAQPSPPSSTSIASIYRSRDRSSHYHSYLTTDRPREFDRTDPASAFFFFLSILLFLPL
jgi:hypothetical protein